jgi:hypothetical protein
MGITLDKSAIWWGYLPDGLVHCYTKMGYALCDSHNGQKATPVVHEAHHHVCEACLVKANTAVHSTKGAHYGS